MLAPKSDEKRKASRHRLARLVTILPGNGAPPRYCRVSDISDGGVRLDVNGFDLPDKFVLLFSGDGPAQDGTYRVIWRLGGEVGAEFVGAA